MNINKALIKEAGIVIGSAALGALVTQVLIHWLPSTTTLAGAVAAGYIAYTKRIG